MWNTTRRLPISTGDNASSGQSVGMKGDDWLIIYAGSGLLMLLRLTIGLSVELQHNLPSIVWNYNNDVRTV